MEKIKIKYFSPDIERIQEPDVGNWIDLRAAEDCYIPAGEAALHSIRRCYATSRGLRGASRATQFDL